VLGVLSITGSLAATVLGVGAYGMFWPRSRLFGSVIGRGDSADPPRVALTFDDGPNENTTPQILDTLKALNVKAAFFVIGANAERYPDVIQRMDREGHVVANHSFDHNRLGVFHRRRYWIDQLERTDVLIEQLIGKRPTLFRPPMGFKHMNMGMAVRSRRQQFVTWTRRAFDTAHAQPDRVIAHLGKAQAGEILTLHDGHEPMHPRDTQWICAVIEPLVELLRSRGYELVRLDELIGIEPYQSTETEMGAE